MTWQAWTTAGVIASTLAALVLTRRPPYLILLGALTLLVTLGVVDEGTALAGFANPGLATVGVLFAVVAGLRETGAMTWIAEAGLGHPRSNRGALARMAAPVMGLSAFLNNTPVVAMMLPVVHDWARKHRLPVSKLLIPLSYASILGGMCTLIGSSTNLVVSGLVLAEGTLPPLELFDIAWVGLPCALVGVSYLLLASPALLPDRKPVLSPTDDARRYTVEMMVEPGSSVAEKTIEQAGLRHLPGLFLMEIDRRDQVIPAPSSSVVLEPGDRLVFAGVVESVVDLQKIRGLTPATSQVFKLDEPRTNRALVEAVVSDTCPMLGRSIREGRFRTFYNAAVIAVARSGERVQKKIGDIVLRSGDTLLLEARASFAEQHRNSRDFYLVSRIDDSTPPRHDRAATALAILAGMVTAAAFGWLSILNAAMLAAGGMIMTRCCSPSAALRAVDWQVLLAIGSAFGLGGALEKSGAAATVATSLLSLAGDDALVALVVVYLLTMIFTELITNNAAAVLVFPIGLQTARQLGVDAMPFVIAIMMAASASFSTPIGYQTNLMVYGPGGYRFSDFQRIGIPLNLLLFAVSILLIPRIWAF